jgi:hypothetical protein
VAAVRTRHQIGLIGRRLRCWCVGVLHVM